MKELLTALSVRKVSRIVSGAAIVSHTMPHSHSGSSTHEKGRDGEERGKKTGG